MPLGVSESTAEDVIFSVMDIESRMKKLNDNKSAGVDNVHPRVLHELNIVSAVPFKKSFENSFKFKYLHED